MGGAARTYAATTDASIVSYILYADDHEEMRLMVRALLTSSGHEVALVANGKAALEALQQREPDLLLLDVMMPEMSGLDACRAVKANPFTARIPILMLTAEGQIDAKVEGFEAGADDYLAKPFDPRELRARVSALLRLVRREADRNPTSGLPGGRAIEEEILRRIDNEDGFAVIYLDIDYFKPFADTFGFAAADAVIKDTASAIIEAVAMNGEAPVDFVGHVGGDDFLIVTTHERAEAVIRESTTRFRDVIGRVVGYEALELGAFPGVDRDGTIKRFPIARMSAAVVTVGPEQWVSIGHLGALAADAKRRAKQLGAGTVLVNAV
jgi:PleD family two-component response regulator